MAKDGSTGSSVGIGPSEHESARCHRVVAAVLSGADVGTEAISASADLQWCRDGVFDTLAGASVSLTRTVEVCASMLGVPACVAL